MRLIDADTLIKACEESTYLNPFATAHLKYIVEGQLTVDPVKQSSWELIGENSSGKIYICGNCNRCINPNKNDVALGRALENPDYCPHCGAKMDADRPPKGKWRLLNGKWTCSECGNKTDWPLKICNVCASEMEIEL